jgi:hypoxanthine phosphoribosyltransferase
MAEHVRVLIPEDEIQNKIIEVADKISEAYKGESLHLICILKGGAMFMCELAKRIHDVNISFDFMSVSSYGSGTTTSGIVKIVKDLDEPLEGKHVLIVEDIIDTGHTLNHLSKLLMSRGPQSIEICTLLNKPSRREKEVPVKYSCFEIPDEFVVGYGLDYDQKYRNLPYIGVVEFD